MGGLHLHTHTLWDNLPNAIFHLCNVCRNPLKDFFQYFLVHSQEHKRIHQNNKRIWNSSSFLIEPCCRKTFEQALFLSFFHPMYHLFVILKWVKVSGAAGFNGWSFICVECKKSVERSFGAIKTLIIHKMLAALLGCGIYGKGVSLFGDILNVVHLVYHFYHLVYTL